MHSLNKLNDIIKYTNMRNHIKIAFQQIAIKNGYLSLVLIDLNHILSYY